MGSLAERVLRVVASEGPFRTTEAVPLIHKAVREPGEAIAIQDVAGVLHTLGKAGKVHTRRRARDNVFTFVEATKDGYRAAGLPAEAIAAEVGTAHHLASLRPSDPTDFRNHGPRAEGGPVTKSRLARFTGDGAAVAAAVEGRSPEKAWEAVVAVASNDGISINALSKVMGLSPSATTISVRKAQTLGCLQPTPYEPRVPKRLHLTAAAKDRLSAPSIQPEDRPDEVYVVTPENDATWPSPKHRAMSRGGVVEQRVSGAQQVIDHLLVDYPTILALLNSSSQLDALAAQLEALGFEDEALTVMARLDSLSPLEREILRLIREKGLAL